MTRLERMNDEPKAEFWCYSALSLTDLFEKFRSSFGIDDGDFTHDAENVWEWFEGNTPDSRFGFNISRPHEDLDDLGLETRPIASEPIRFSIRIRDAKTSADEIGLRLAAALGVEVHTGAVTCVRGDEFEYRSSKTFQPMPRPTGAGVCSASRCDRC